MPLPHGQAPGAVARGRLTGRWRYDRAAGRGIALSYDRGVSRLSIARLSDVRAGQCFTGRWRYNRVVGRGIALSYCDNTSGPPTATPAAPELASPPVTDAPRVRVLCSCGDMFTFEGDAGTCPGCGRGAEWPTLGAVEREMRSDLDELLRAHEPGAEPDSSSGT